MRLVKPFSDLDSTFKCNFEVVKSGKLPDGQKGFFVGYVDLNGLKETSFTPQKLT